MGGATLVGVGVGIKAYGTYRGFGAAATEYKYRKQIARSNIKIKQEVKKDVAASGLKAEKQIETQAIQEIGEQVTRFASGGIDVASAVVRDVTEETARTRAADVITLQKNIERQRWGLDLEIMNEEMTAEFNKREAKRAKKLGILSTAGVIAAGAGSLALRGTPPPVRRTSSRELSDILKLGPGVASNVPGGLL